MSSKAPDFMCPVRLVDSELFCKEAFRFGEGDLYWRTWSREGVRCLAFWHWDEGSWWSCETFDKLTSILDVFLSHESKFPGNLSL